MEIVVRKASLEEARELAELMNMAGEGIPAYLWAQQIESGEDVMAFGARRVAREDSGFSYTNAHVASVSGELAGMLLGYRLPDAFDAGELERCPDVVRPLLELEAEAPGAWYVNAVATVPAHRGQGVGTRLLRLAETLARDTGAASIALIVAEGNAAAVRLYDRLGYRTVARRGIVPYPGCTHTGQWMLMRREVDWVASRER